MSFIDMQVKYLSRDTATGYPNMSNAIVDLQQECNEDINGTMEVIAGASLVEISMGSISKGRFLVIEVLEDDTNGREALEIRLNNSANDAWSGTIFAHEADTTTGITAIYVSNSGSNSIKFRYLIAGDVV